MIELPTDEARRTPEKDEQVYAMLAGMDAKIEIEMARVRLPYANDLYLRLCNLQSAVAKAMDVCDGKE